MDRLTDAAWLGTTTLQTEEVEVPELNGTVLIKELPGEFATSHFVVVENPGTRHARSRVDYEALERAQFRLGVVEPTFTEEQVVEIAKKHGSAYRRVIAAIDKLSGLDKESAEQTAARFPARGSGETGTNGTGDAAGDSGSAVRMRTGASAGEERTGTS